MQIHTLKENSLVLENLNSSDIQIVINGPFYIKT